MDISWTTKGLMIFDRENGNLYRGNEKSLKFFKAIEKYHRNYITPDGDELLMISELPDYGISLILYNLIGNDSRVIYTKYAKLTKQEMAIDTIIIQSIQYSTFSNELTVFANWPPIRPIYVDENRVCKEIPIGRSGRLWYIIHGVAIWKPGVVAYVEDNGKGKRPVTILSMKMK
jgi:hypothetical protein